MTENVKYTLLKITFHIIVTLKYQSLNINRNMVGLGTQHYRNRLIFNKGNNKITELRKLERILV